MTIQMYWLYLGPAILVLLALYIIYILVFTLLFIGAKGKLKTRRFCLIAIAVPPIGVICFGLMLSAYAAFMDNPITQDRIVGTYRVDSSFYPGANSDWQAQHFYFEVRNDDRFIFYEKLADGRYKTVEGRVEWYNASPDKFRIVMAKPHALIDELPTLYRGNRKFYYVFNSKFGNIFWRKEK